MGVNIYVLERHRATLMVGDKAYEVGALRRFWKITELDFERNAELSRAAKYAIPSPLAAMIAEPEEHPLAATGAPVKAHLLIGWDEERSTVTDAGWDYLPILGYAVRQKDGAFILHEKTDKGLLPVDQERALSLGLITADGQLAQHGQPLISECRDVKPFIQGYAEADCTLASGQRERLLIGVIGEEIPSREWLVGRTPREAAEYFPKRPRGSAPVP